MKKLPLLLIGFLSILNCLYAQQATYDKQGRLTKYTDKKGNQFAYEYDAVGNRTKYVIKVAEEGKPELQITGSDFSETEYEQGQQIQFNLELKNSRSTESKGD